MSLFGKKTDFGGVDSVGFEKAHSYGMLNIQESFAYAASNQTAE